MVTETSLRYPFKVTRGFFVNKSTFAPMIYTVLCVMLLILAVSIIGQVGGGFGPGNLDFQLDSISQCPKKSQGPTPYYVLEAYLTHFSLFWMVWGFTLSWWGGGGVRLG